MKKVAIFSLMMAMAQASSAQTPRDTIPADSVIPLEGVVVSSVRRAATTGGSSAVVADPDSLHVVPAPTLEAVLRALPFIAIRENSRGQAEISVRGSDSRQVAVLVDGIPLTLGWDHRTDPSIVPITGARSITLVRGLHSVLYGPNVLGGVVEVGITQPARPARTRGGDASPYRISFGGDVHGTTSIAAVADHPLRTAGGDWRLRAGGGFRERGSVPVPDAVRDTFTREAGRRANSDLRHLDSFVAARYDAVDGRWAGLTASGYTSQRGVPPELHTGSPRLWRYPSESRLLAILSGGTGHRSTRWGTGDVEASVGLDLGRTEIERYETARFETVSGGETGAGRTLTVRLLGDHTLPAGGTVTGAATFADVSHEEHISGAEPAKYRQRLWSVASELAQPFGGSSRLSTGIAIDGADTPETGGRPPLGALRAWGARIGLSTLVGENARLHAAATRRARFPSLRELYSGALGRFDPNPNLRPETLIGAEIGVTGTLGRLDVQGVGFHHRLSDAIVRTVTAEGLYRRVNQHEIRSTGLELLADLHVRPLRARADLMLQDVALTGWTGGGGSGRPEHQPRVRGNATLEAPIAARLGAVAAASYTGAQYCVHPDTGADVRLAPGAVLDLGLASAWSGEIPVRASAFLQNATDAAMFDQCGLPQPGRTLTFAVQIG